MNDGSSKPMHDAAREMHEALGAIDDLRFNRIIAVVDQVSNPEVNQVLLDPLRQRLAQLKPARPLRLSRLLFLPLQPLIVPARGWRSGQARVPRSILTIMTRLVRVEMDADGDELARAIASQTTASAQVIADAGDILWPRAAEILTRAPPPESWAETSLPPAVFRPMAQAIAAVLRRAPLLYRLMRDAEVGVLQSDTGALDAIMRNLADEPPEGAAMVTQLILMQSPQATQLLRRFVSSSTNRFHAVALNETLGRGVDQTLSHFERETDYSKTIACSAPRDAASQVSTIMTLLDCLEKDAASVRHKPRLRAIRQKLARSCEECFTNGLREALVEPLTVHGGVAVDGTEQMRLEAAARDLRGLDSMGRRLGSAASYDRSLMDTCKTVNEALSAGTITLIRAARLLEILGGAQEAAALYRPAD